VSIGAALLGYCELRRIHHQAEARLGWISSYPKSDELPTGIMKEMTRVGVTAFEIRQPPCAGYPGPAPLPADAKPPRRDLALPQADRRGAR